MVAFRNTDTSGRTTGLLLRCVLYSLLALGLIIVDKRYDHLGRIRRAQASARRPPQRGGRIAPRESDRVIRVLPRIYNGCSGVNPVPRAGTRSL